MQYLLFASPALSKSFTQIVCIVPVVPVNQNHLKSSVNDTAWFGRCGMGLGTFKKYIDYIILLIILFIYYSYLHFSSIAPLQPVLPMPSSNSLPP